MKNNRYYINGQGLRIKKCCGSCMHKEIQTLGQSICMIGNGYVESCDYCDAWYIRSSLLTIPRVKRQGNVKKPEYLQWLAATMKDIDAGLQPKQTTAQLAKRWEEIHGSRYIICTPDSTQE